jgi:hypothetical protein
LGWMLDSSIGNTSLTLNFSSSAKRSTSPLRSLRHQCAAVERLHRAAQALRGVGCLGGYERARQHQRDAQ